MKVQVCVCMRERISACVCEYKCMSESTSCVCVCVCVHACVCTGKCQGLHIKHRLAILTYFMLANVTCSVCTLPTPKKTPDVTHS